MEREYYDNTSGTGLAAPWGSKAMEGNSTQLQKRSKWNLLFPRRKLPWQNFREILFAILWPEQQVFKMVASFSLVLSLVTALQGKTPLFCSEMVLKLRNAYIDAWKQYGALTTAVMRAQVLETV